MSSTPAPVFPLSLTLLLPPLSRPSVQAKMDKKEYRELDDIQRDFDLMFDNALAYFNDWQHEVVEDAMELSQCVNDIVRNLKDQDYLPDTDRTSDGRHPVAPCCWALCLLPLPLLTLFPLPPLTLPP